MDLIKELLEFFGISKGYHIYIILFASFVFFVGSAVLVYVRKLYKHFKKTNWGHIRVHDHRVWKDDAGQWHLRFEECGRIPTSEIGGLLADRLVTASKETTKESAIVMMKNPDDQVTLLNEVVSLTGALPGLLTRSVSRIYANKWHGALFCEKYSGLNISIKYFLISDEVMKLLSNPKITVSIWNAGLEMPHHKDRLVSLLDMIKYIEKGGIETTKGWYPIVREVRGILS